MMNCPPYPKTQVIPAHGYVGMMQSMAVVAATGIDKLQDSAGASLSFPAQKPSAGL